MRVAALTLVATAALCSTTLAGVQYNGVDSSSPLLTAEQGALINNRLMSTSTGLITVAANQVLDGVLTNPAGSGCTFHFTLRRYGNFSTSVLQTVVYSGASPITVPSGTASTAGGTKNMGNLLNGSGVAPPTISFSYLSRAAGSMAGTPGVTDGLLAMTESERTTEVGLVPGASYGIEITGAQGGALTASVQVSMTLVGYCS